MAEAYRYRIEHSDPENDLETVVRGFYNRSQFKVAEQRARRLSLRPDTSLVYFVAEDVNGEGIGQRVFANGGLDSREGIDR